MNESATPVPSRDIEHLRLLEIFHYILAGLIGLMACLPIIHVIIGLIMIINPDSMSGPEDERPPAFVGYLFAGMGLIFVVGGWTIALFTLASGRMIAKRKRRTFSIVIAALLCTFMPFGTVLGVFTIIILCRESVARSYGES